jgi:hypothetical protein
VSSRSALAGLLMGEEVAPGARYTNSCFGHPPIEG